MSEIGIQPVVNWPKQVEPGTSYLVTVDLRLTDPRAPWPYEEEEFVVGCMLDGRPNCTVRAHGDAGVVLHRFGGSYGPARFLVETSADCTDFSGAALWLTLTTAGGVPFYTGKLPLDGSPVPEAVDVSREIGTQPRSQGSAAAQAEVFRSDNSSDKGKIEEDKLQFRLSRTGEETEIRARVDDAGLTAGEFLIARKVRLRNGVDLRQHRPAGRTGRRQGYERLDNEIFAGRQLHEVAFGERYPPEVACLYGDKATSAEPYTLFEPYRGKPLSQEGTRILPNEFEAFLISLLTGLCWLAAAEIAHRAINLDTVLWDSHQRRVQITDLSMSTVFGSPRTPLTGASTRIPVEHRQGTAYGVVGPRDDIWAAGRLIFFVRSRGDDLVSRSQIERSGLDPIFSGMFDSIFGPPEKRPTARDLLIHGLRHKVSLPPAADGSALVARRAKFLKVRGRKHPEAPVPPDLNDDINWTGASETGTRPSERGER